MIRNAVYLFAIILWGQICRGQNPPTTVVIRSIVGYTPYDDFAGKAAHAFEVVLNSDQFKQGVLKRDFIRTNGLSNEELYTIIMKAHEQEGDSGQDLVVDLRLRTLDLEGADAKWKDNCSLNSHSGTIGIDGNGDGIMAICPQRLAEWAQQSDLRNLAGHFAHEYMHILGFNHSKFLANQHWREKTFVYKIGNLVYDLVDKMGLNQ